LPAGYYFTIKDAPGTSGSNDSDADIITGETDEQDIDSTKHTESLLQDYLDVGLIQ
jgi:hypothetical protein